MAKKKKKKKSEGFGPWGGQTKGQNMILEP
jgi:hypothetical protein